MPIEQLWSPADDTRLLSFRRAAEAGQLADALFAIEGAGEGRSKEALARLASLGERVRWQLGPDPSPSDQLRALSAVMTEAGFRGEETNYHALENSYLSRVVERGRGLPILLSAVWILVGERAAIDVDGIGLPGHFIVRVGGARGILADPFASGAPRTVDECKELVRRMSQGELGWRPEFLAPSSVASILERVLRNLLGGQAELAALAALYRTARLWCALRPDAVEPHAQLARIADRLGAPALSADAHADLLARFPGTAEARRAEQQLSRLRARRQPN